jgi:hypothetical protein
MIQSNAFAEEYQHMSRCSRKVKKCQKGSWRGEDEAIHVTRLRNPDILVCLHPEAFSEGDELECTEF